MRIRSKALWQYLSDTGALNGYDEDIAKAKAEYRRIYKRTWKRKQQLPKKELRIVITPKEYGLLKLSACDAGYKSPTAFVRQYILNAHISAPTIPNKELLFQVSKYIGSAVILLFQNRAQQNILLIKEYISKADALLLQYLKENR